MKTCEGQLKSSMERHFALAAPCGNCPFRKEGAIHLEPGRLAGIVASLTENDGGTFQCHKTVHHRSGGVWEEDGSYTPSGNESMCVGAAIYLEKVGRPTVAMRIARVLNAYEPEKFMKFYGEIIDPPIGLAGS